MPLRSAIRPDCVKTTINKLLTQCYVKSEVNSLENVVRFKCEAHVFINFGANNSLEIVFTQPEANFVSNQYYSTAAMSDNLPVSNDGLYDKNTEITVGQSIECSL